MKNKIINLVIVLLLIVIGASSCFVSRDGRPRHHRGHDEVIIKGRIN